ncbi:hypothetical protein CAMGR0001_2731 [Campylobacter gracilis RM3268]|uniref:Uncharacterized protein n=1 Tax=Campylobacter gracilis RM3268 TaxID=553220 RepID=C8PF90_9BACT|nr:hypothetical protein CAMGR0001_2731 [Campylobacter gracilis RM3268]
MFLRVSQSKPLARSCLKRSAYDPPDRAQLRRGAKFHPNKDKFMKKD